MGCSSSIHTDKRIVIVGGGYAGVKVAMALKDYNIVLIDAKDSFVHNVANIRAVVEPALIQKIYINYSFTFGEKFIQGRVASVDAEHQRVTLENQQSVPYDVLVLATGARARVDMPTKLWSQSKQQAQEMFNELHEKVKASQRIAVLGAGAVGVEVAGEIATDFPGKEVLLVGSSTELIQPGLSKKLQAKVKDILETKLKCKLVLGSRVENLEELTGAESGPYTVKLEDGSTHEVDLVLPCMGVEVNSSAYAEGLASSMTDQGALRVNEYLQVEGHKDIFALGDCTAIEERKLTLNAENQADAFLRNLKLLVEGKPMKPYKPDQIPVKVVVSLGRASGAGESAGGSVLPEFIVTNLKSKGLFIDRSWKSMDQKMPK